jgi:hypothetical protein
VRRDPCLDCSSFVVGDSLVKSDVHSGSVRAAMKTGCHPVG